MEKLLGYVRAVLGKSTEVIDAAVPAGHGNRTAVAVIGALAVQALPTILPLIPPPYGSAIAMALPLLGQLFTIAAPIFALAHMNRKPAA